MVSPAKLRQEFENIASELDRLVLDPESFTETTLRPGPAQLVAPRKIVVGVDGSPQSQRAVAWATALAKEYDAEIDVVTTVGQGAAFLIYKEKATSLERSELKIAEAALDAAKARLLRAGFHPEVTLLRGDPAREIAKHAQETHADLVVVGDRGRGKIARALLGSVASKIKDIAPCDVLIAKSSPPPVRILVAVDGSPESKQAFALATRLADDWSATASVLLAIPPPGFAALGEARFAYHRRFDPMNLPRLQNPRIRFEIEFGRPADVILTRARRGESNLVFVGSRGLGRSARVLMGSVSSRVAAESSSNVWVVRKNGRPFRG